MEILMTIIGAMVLILIFVIINPLVCAAGGYFAGWVLSSIFKFAGLWVVNGASALGLEFTLAQLPLLGAFLGFVSAFFKSGSDFTKKKE